MERLDIDASRDEVTLLMEETDNNGDGEIDYQEILAQFEHLARNFSHGKRRDSVFFNGHSTPSDSYSLTNEQKLNLIATLRCIGVSCLDRDGSVLTLPFENSALRDAIWNTYIRCESNESKYRTLLIESLSKKEPAPRYCEELPWHLKKEKKWVEMKTILVDLRILDIMFHSIELKAELFTYLRNLSLGAGGKVKFDIIAEYNRSVEQWNQHSKPSSKQTSMMLSFIADVMAWFDVGIWGLAQSPLFLRERVGDEYLLKLGIDASTSRERIGSAGSKTAGLRTPGGKISNEIHSEAQYFFNRWIWIQFPWIALKNAAIIPEDNYHHPKANVTGDNTGGEVQPADYSMNLREKAMIRAKVNDLNYTLDMIKSTKPKKKATPSTPLSLRELKIIHDRLRLETESRERQFNELERARKARSVSDLKNQMCVVSGKGALRALQSRMDQINDVIGRASSVDLIFNDILLALHGSAPSPMRQIELEQQIVLSRQQISDLTEQRKKITNETEKKDFASKQVAEEVKSIVQERQRILPLLDSLRTRASEESDQKKISRVASFDPAAFSRRLRIEGKLAKRREERNLKRNASGFEVVDINKASKLHPMERIAQITGTRDPHTIFTMLNETEIEELKLRHEQSEQHVKDQLAKLESLGSQMSQRLLSDGNVKLGSAAIDQHDQRLYFAANRKRLIQCPSLLIPCIWPFSI